MNGVVLDDGLRVTVSDHFSRPRSTVDFLHFHPLSSNRHVRVEDVACMWGYIPCMWLHFSTERTFVRDKQVSMICVSQSHALPNDVWVVVSSQKPHFQVV